MIRRRHNVTTCHRVVLSVIAVVFLIASILAIILNVIYLRSTCPELVTVQILSNDTIKAGDFSSCPSGVTVKREDKDTLTAKVFSYNCIELEDKLYEEPVTRRNESTYVPRGCHSVYNYSNNNYFANTFDGFISVYAIAKSTAKISVCLSENEHDYKHYETFEQLINNKYKTECEDLMNVSTEQKFTYFHIFEDLSSKYYFVSICTTGQLTFLKYNFFTTREYYSDSDFTAVDDNSCNMPLGSHECRLETTPDCVMMHTTPFIKASNFSEFSIHPNYYSGQKFWYVIIYIVAVIFFISSSILCFCTRYKLVNCS